MTFADQTATLYIERWALLTDWVPEHPDCGLALTKEACPLPVLAVSVSSDLPADVHDKVLAHLALRAEELHHGLDGLGHGYELLIPMGSTDRDPPVIIELTTFFDGIQTKADAPLRLHLHLDGEASLIRALVDDPMFLLAYTTGKIITPVVFNPYRFAAAVSLLAAHSKVVDPLASSH